MTNKIEICWTGPTKNRHIRLTGPALEELLYSAKKSIIIVGYSINIGIKDQLDFLVKKSREQVQLTFMIDRLHEKKDFLQWLKRLPMPAEVYDRPPDSEDDMSALHIKCIIVDEEKAMFGSANLTYHGIKGNIELGIIIEDQKIVKKIVDLLNELKMELVKIDL